MLAASGKSVYNTPCNTPCEAAGGSSPAYSSLPFVPFGETPNGRVIHCRAEDAIRVVPSGFGAVLFADGLGIFFGMMTVLDTRASNWPFTGSPEAVRSFSTPCREKQ
eukprot:407278-Pyramimonas_sp.AAC.1